MPQTVVKIGPQLGIRLDRADHIYLPGENISGHVVRESHIVSSKATVSISLHARSKSRMVVHHGHITSTHRGRFDLVKPVEYVQTIFQGPLHIAMDGGEQLWPFSIKLPTNVDLSAVSDTTQDQSFLPVDTINNLTHRLPPTFCTENYQYMSGMSAFVEYFLQAELKTSSRGSSNAADAILPFKLLQLNLQPTDITPPLQTSRHTLRIPSSLFKTGQGKAGATQQMDNLSGSSTEPEFVLDIQVQAPTVLQINSPDPVPFFVLAVPNLAQENDHIRLSSQEIHIARLSVHIVARTEVKCSARKKTHEADHQTNINLHAEDAYRRYGNILCIPWDRLATEGDVSQENRQVSGRASSEPLNVGEKIGLRLERREDLYATFQTYNIRHTHNLKWEMTVELAGKSFEVAGEDVVEISTLPELERSTEWIRPPSEDRLPSFSEHQGDLAASELEQSNRDRESRSGGVGGLSRLWDF